MPLYEFNCKKHGLFECFTLEKYDTRPCPKVIAIGMDKIPIKCGKESEKVEYSVPARRNPEHGVQK